MIKIEDVWPQWHIDERFTEKGKSDEGLIGRGGFGEVYRAYKEQMGEKYYSAIKIIQIPGNNENLREVLMTETNEKTVRMYLDGQIKEILNEINVLENLKTAGNVVKIEDFTAVQREDKYGWRIFIRMELLQSLEDWLLDYCIFQTRKTDIRIALKVASDISNALTECNKMKIIHRDIKNSNVFISPFGSFKLGDFGISKHLDRTRSMHTQRGTDNYMAPEVFKEMHYDKTVDIYSLGIMIYRMLNNYKWPFEPQDHDAMPDEKQKARMRRYSGEELEKPINADDELSYIIKKACSYEPKDRYQEPEELKSAIDDYIWSKKLNCYLDMQLYDDIVSLQKKHNLKEK